MVDEPIVLGNGSIVYGELEPDACTKCGHRHREVVCGVIALRFLLCRDGGEREGERVRCQCVEAGWRL